MPGRRTDAPRTDDMLAGFDPDAAPPPRSAYATVRGRELHYTTAGDPANPRVLLCVHGMSRTCRDFDAVLSVMGRTHRVLAVDLAGRGLSQWAADPVAEYSVAGHVAQLVGLLDALGVAKVDWLGTFIGGIVGYCAAAGPLAHRVQRLLLNDVGPGLDDAALEAIQHYAAEPKVFETMAALEAFFRAASATFGPLPPRWFRATAQAQARRLPCGAFTTHYDPRVAAALGRPLVADPTAAAAANALDGARRRRAAGFATRVQAQMAAAAATDEERIAEAHEEAAAVEAAADAAKADLQRPGVCAANLGETAKWAEFDRVACKTLVLRGATSDVLTPAGVAQMQARGLPSFRVVTVPGAGHAPALVTAETLRLVVDFFLDHDGQEVPVI